MEIIEAIREIQYHFGIGVMSDAARYKAILDDLAPQRERQRRRIALAYFCGAMKQICNALHDAGAAAPFFEEAVRLLVYEADMNESAAAETVEYFRQAFGFPGYRGINPELSGVITDDTNERCVFVYEGEIKDGKPHGIGTRTCYYDGKFAEKDESVWYCGVMNGYCKNTELFMQSIMVYTEYYVINDVIYGIETSMDEDGLGERVEYKNGKRNDLWQSESK